MAHGSSLSGAGVLHVTPSYLRSEPPYRASAPDAWSNGTVYSRSERYGSAQSMAHHTVQYSSSQRYDPPRASYSSQNAHADRASRSHPHETYQFPETRRHEQRLLDRQPTHSRPSYDTHPDYSSSIRSLQPTSHSRHPYDQHLPEPRRPEYQDARHMASTTSRPYSPLPSQRAASPSRAASPTTRTSIQSPRVGSSPSVSTRKKPDIPGLARPTEDHIMTRQAIERMLNSDMDKMGSAMSPLGPRDSYLKFPEKLAEVHPITPTPTKSTTPPEAALSPRKREQVMLKANLDRMGYKEHFVRADGNCQFRTLAFYLYNDQEEHGRVRDEVIDQLKNLPSLYQDFVIGGAEGYAKFCVKMARPNEWGDHLTLQAAADRYRMLINIVTCHEADVSTGRGGAFLKIRPRDNSGSVIASEDEVWMSFYEEQQAEHYNPLVKATEKPPTDTR